MTEREKIKAEMERLKNDYIADEKRAKEMMAREVQQLEEDTKRDIDNEASYHRNCLDIAIVKLRRETEKEVERVTREAYKDLGTMEEMPDHSIEEAAAELVKLNMNEREKGFEREREEFEAHCRERRCRFEAQMQRLMMADYRDDKKPDVLKKTVVPIVHSSGMRKIADEAVFDRRGYKITRNALSTGESWALYRARCGSNKSGVCLITVHNKVAIQIR